MDRYFKARLIGDSYLSMDSIIAASNTCFDRDVLLTYRDARIEQEFLVYQSVAAHHRTHVSAGIAMFLAGLSTILNWGRAVTGSITMLTCSVGAFVIALVDWLMSRALMQLIEREEAARLQLIARAEAGETARRASAANNKRDTKRLLMDSSSDERGDLREASEALRDRKVLLATLLEYSAFILLLLLGLSVAILLYGDSTKYCVYVLAWDGREDHTKCQDEINKFFTTFVFASVTIKRPRFLLCAPIYALMLLVGFTIRESGIGGRDAEQVLVSRFSITIVLFAFGAVLKYLSELQFRSEFVAYAICLARKEAVAARNESTSKFVESIIPRRLKPRLLVRKASDEAIVDVAMNAMVIVTNIDDVNLFINQRLPTDAALAICGLSSISLALCRGMGLDHIRTVGDSNYVTCNLLRKVSHPCHLGVAYAVALAENTELAIRSGCAIGSLVGMTIGGNVVRFDITGPALDEAQRIASQFVRRGVRITAAVNLQLPAGVTRRCLSDASSDSGSNTTASTTAGQTSIPLEALSTTHNAPPAPSPAATPSAEHGDAAPTESDPSPRPLAGTTDQLDVGFQVAATALAPPIPPTVETRHTLATIATTSLDHSNDLVAVSPVRLHRTSSAILAASGASTIGTAATASASVYEVLDHVSSESLIPEDLEFPKKVDESGRSGDSDEQVEERAIDNLRTAVVKGWKRSASHRHKPGQGPLAPPSDSPLIAPSVAAGASDEEGGPEAPKPSSPELTRHLLRVSLDHYTYLACALFNTVLNVVMLGCTAAERRSSFDGGMRAAVACFVASCAAWLSAAALEMCGGPLRARQLLFVVGTVLTDLGATFTRPSVAGTDITYLAGMQMITAAYSLLPTPMITALQLLIAALYFVLLLAWRPITRLMGFIALPAISIGFVIWVLLRRRSFNRRLESIQSAKEALQQMRDDQQWRLAVIRATIPDVLLETCMSSCDRGNFGMTSWSVVDVTVIALQLGKRGGNSSTSVVLGTGAAPPRHRSGVGGVGGVSGLGGVGGGGSHTNNGLSSSGSSGGGLTAQSRSVVLPLQQMQPGAFSASDYMLSTSMPALPAAEQQQVSTIVAHFRDAEAFATAVAAFFTTTSRSPALRTVKVFGGSIFVAGPLHSGEEREVMRAVTEAFSLAAALMRQGFAFTAGMAIEQTINVVQISEYPTFDIFGPAITLAHALMVEAPAEMAVATERLVKVYLDSGFYDESHESAAGGVRLCAAENWRIRGKGSVRVHRVAIS